MADDPLFPSGVLPSVYPGRGACLRVPSTVMAEKAAAQGVALRKTGLKELPDALLAKLPLRAAPNQRSISMAYHRLFVRKPRLAEALKVPVVPLSDFLRREGALIRLDAANTLLFRRAGQSMLILDSRLIGTSDRILGYVRPRLQPGPDSSRLSVLWAPVIELVDRRQQQIQTRRDKTTQATKDKQGRLDSVATDKQRLEAVRLLRARARGEAGPVTQKGLPKKEG